MTMMHASPSRMRMPVKIAKPPQNRESNQVSNDCRRMHVRGKFLGARTSEKLRKESPCRDREKLERRQF